VTRETQFVLQGNGSGVVGGRRSGEQLQYGEERGENRFEAFLFQEGVCELERFRGGIILSEKHRHQLVGHKHAGLGSVGVDPGSCTL
jgi:hypothetical protein